MCYVLAHAVEKTIALEVHLLEPRGSVCVCVCVPLGDLTAVALKDLVGEKQGGKGNEALHVSIILSHADTAYPVLLLWVKQFLGFFS